jgi:hypothetical protein
MNDHETEALSRREFVQIVAQATAVIAAGAGMLSPAIALALPPVWEPVPDQTWVIGVPVHLDLADYCTDPEGAALVYSMDGALPAGITLDGSVISGTPTAEFSAAEFRATADDSETPDTQPPGAPQALTVF